MRRIVIALGLGALTEIGGAYAIAGSFGAAAYIAAFWAHLPFAALHSAPSGTLGWALFLASGMLSWSIVWWVILLLATRVSRAVKSRAA